MKKPVSKATIRSEIEQQIDDYLNKGGKVDEIDRGISGHQASAGPIKPDKSLFQQPKATRTYVPEVIAAIDARRKVKHPAAKSSSRQPRKKIIYDDFGEPLRWAWVDD